MANRPGPRNTPYKKPPKPSGNDYSPEQRRRQEAPAPTAKYHRGARIK